jgi:threonine dehydratase
VNVLSPNAIDTQAALRRCESYVRRTPLLPSPRLSALAGQPVLLKPECLQVTGSFKARGAINRLLQLEDDERGRGVVTASAGNHGQAVAWAASVLGIRATVVLPLDAVPVKVERTRSWGATVVQAGHGYDEAHHHAERLCAQTGAVYIHSFEHPEVIAGQGTVAHEILDDCPEAGLLVAPVGGGGLIGGIGAAVRTYRRPPQVIGLQSGNTSAMFDALAAGHLTPVTLLPTLADGLAGETTEASMQLCRQFGIAVRLVPEAALLPAIRHTLVDEHLAIEGSAAVCVAAILERVIYSGVTDGPIVLVLSGGNVDPTVLSAALAGEEAV